jgi:hypothetical protein
MFRVMVILALISVSSLCSGQSDSVSIVSGRKPAIKLSYNSSLIYPGVSAGAEYMFKEKEIVNQKRKSKQNCFTRKQLITMNLSWYHHYGFHDNIYLTSEWATRKKRRSGYYSEFSAGSGYSRTFLGGTTYMVGEDGNISIKKHAGYNYAVATTGGGIGYDFSSRHKTPVSVFTKMNLIFMFPYNSSIYFRPVLELGVRLNTIIFSEIKHKDDSSDNFK